MIYYAVIIAIVIFSVGDEFKFVGVDKERKRMMIKGREAGPLLYL